MIEELLRPEVQTFLQQYEGTDPGDLILKFPSVAGVPIATLADQLKSRSKAKEKIPQWYATRNIIFPWPGLLEQASSQTTAQYKARWFSGQKMADLTGGTGVDTYYMAQNFHSADYVEPNRELVTLAQHNFKTLGLSAVNFYHTKAEAYLQDHGEEIDLLYLDPSRRKEGQKVFFLDQCKPDIKMLASSLVQKAKTVLVKVSPMIDPGYAIRHLKRVHQVHVVSVNNDCKEVLLVLKNMPCDDPEIVAVNSLKTGLDQEFRFCYSDEKSQEVAYHTPKNYLYEPNSAILKSGAFKSIAGRYSLAKLHPHSHLYTSGALIEGFPGRSFEILGLCKYDKKAILAVLPQGKANIATRNFPVSVEDIRKKTGIKPGGEHFIFATTDVDNHKILIISRKLL